MKNIFRSYSILPCYHIVSDLDVPHVKHLYPIKSVKQFCDEIDFLCKNFNMVGIDEIVKGSKKRMAHLTFDDGYRECHDVIMPILLEKGIPATFFVCTDFIDNRHLHNRCVMSLLYDKVSKIKDQKILNELSLLAGNYKSLRDWLLSFDTLRDDLIERLCEIVEVDIQGYLSEKKPYLSDYQIHDMVKKGFTIGSHGKNHINFRHLNLESQVNEAISTSKYISERYNQEKRYFAFPYEDLSISNEFYLRIQDDIDFTFGTAGYFKDHPLNSFQRIWMESGDNQNIEAYLSFKYRQKMLRVLIESKDYISRV